MTQVLEAGDVLDGRYRLAAKLGQGAFGAVYQAEDLEASARPIAVKVLFDKYHQDRKMRQRFVQEAKLLQDLEHPSIATAFGWRADDDLAYLVMELIDGQSLDQRCEAHSESGRLIPKQGIAWVCDQLCSAVEFAHARGVVHRDLKPRNVMVNRAGARPFVKVLDFGIAKVLVGGEVDPTTVGRVLGSVLYIAPEQILSRTLDHRADVFSVGTILFEMLTLRRAWARTAEGDPHPFHEPVPIGQINNHVAVLRRIARDPRPSATAYRADLSPAVDLVLHKALAIDADRRFDSAAAFAAALRVALLEDRIPPGLEDSLGTATVANRPLPRPPAEDQDEDEAAMAETAESPVPPNLPPVPAVRTAPAETPPAAPAPPAAVTDPGDLVPEDVTAETPAQLQPALRIEATETMPEGPVGSETGAPPPARSALPWLALGVMVAVATVLVLAFGLQG